MSKRIVDAVADIEPVAVPSVDPRVTALLAVLQPSIVELDCYPRPNRINPATGAVMEYGSKGDQHCPTLSMDTWQMIVEVEPFATSKQWEYLHALRDAAVGVRSREIPGLWLRAVYNVLNTIKGG